MACTGGVHPKGAWRGANLGDMGMMGESMSKLRALRPVPVLSKSIILYQSDNACCAHELHSINPLAVPTNPLSLPRKQKKSIIIKLHKPIDSQQTNWMKQLVLTVANDLNRLHSSSSSVVVVVVVVGCLLASLVTHYKAQPYKSRGVDLRRD